MSNLRKAAEELIEAWDWDCSEPRNKALRDLIEALRQALAQPNDFIYSQNHAFRISPSTGDFGIGSAPAKREWVGLMDEDLKPLCDEWRIMYGGYVDDFAKAIEAKLKEKNGVL